MKPTDVRYIKLGQGGRWEKVSLENNELHFGYDKISHELALSLDKEAIKAQRIQSGRLPRVASHDAREIIDFYSLDESCLLVLPPKSGPT